MAVNYFVGWTQTELEAELRRAQAELGAGASVGSVGAGDTQAQFSKEHSAKERIEMLLKALNALDPTTYPAESVFGESQTLYYHPG